MHSEKTLLDSLYEIAFVRLGNPKEDLTELDKSPSRKVAKYQFDGGRLFDGDNRTRHDFPLPGELLFGENFHKIEEIYNDLLSETDLETAQAYIAQSILREMESKGLVTVSKSVSENTPQALDFDYHISPNMKNRFKPLFDNSLSDEEMEKEIFLSLYQGIVGFGFETKKLSELQSNLDNLSGKAKNNSLSGKDIQNLNHYFHLSGITSKAVAIVDGKIQIEGIEREKNSHFINNLMVNASDNFEGEKIVNNTFDIAALAPSVFSGYAATHNTKAPNIRGLAKQGYNLLHELDHSYDSAVYSVQVRAGFLQACDQALSELNTLIKQNYDNTWEPGNNIEEKQDDKKKAEFAVIANLYKTIQAERDTVVNASVANISSAQKNIVVNQSATAIQKAINTSESHPAIKTSKISLLFSALFEKIKNFFRNFFHNNAKETLIKPADTVNRIKNIIIGHHMENKSSSKTIKEDDDEEGEGNKENIKLK